MTLNEYYDEVNGKCIELFGSVAYPLSDEECRVLITKLSDEVLEFIVKKSNVPSFVSSWQNLAKNEIADRALLED